MFWVRRMLVLICFLLICGCNSSSSFTDEAKPSRRLTTNPLDELQGKWQAVLGEENGIREDPKSFENHYMLVERDIIQIYNKDQLVETSRITIDDASNDPKELTITEIDATGKPVQAKTKEGEDVSFARPGIYKVEGDTWTICTAASPMIIRPRIFSAPKESGFTLLVLKRIP